MRPSFLLSLLFVLGTSASAVRPHVVRDANALAEADNSIAHGVDPRVLNAATAGDWHLFPRTNDGKPATTKVSVVGTATDAGADAIVIGAMKTDDGFTIVGDGLGAERNGQIVGTLEALGLSSTNGNTVRFPGQEGDGAPLIVVVSLGKLKSDPKPETLRRAAGAAVRQLAGYNKVAVVLPTDSPEKLYAVTEGAALGAYNFIDYKTSDPTPPAGEVVVVTSAEGANEAAARAEIVSRHVKGSRRLTTIPANELYPQSFLDRVNEAVSGMENVEVEVWDENRLRDEGLNLLLNVGVGSARPPRLVKVTYNGGDKGHVALIGKGITFDSGGYNLKSGASMATMKSDMTGAGVVFHSALAAAELKLPVRVTAWLCLAENLVDGLAQRPGDIWTAYNGKTVEITNTDAEGRLVMADGLSKAAEEKPDLMIDVATLTGAQVTALGDRNAGLMGDEGPVEAVKKAAVSTGEGFWYMPFFEEFYADMVSPIADYRNSGTGSDGGMQKGGIFLEPFAMGVPWAHLDIAGPAFNEGSAYGYTPTQGTGFSVRTLIQLIQEHGQK